MQDKKLAMQMQSHLHGCKLEVMGDVSGRLVNPAHRLDQRLRVVLRPRDQISTTSVLQVVLINYFCNYYLGISKEFGRL